MITLGRRTVSRDDAAKADAKNRIEEKKAEAERERAQAMENLAGAEENKAQAELALARAAAVPQEQQRKLLFG